MPGLGKKLSKLLASLLFLFLIPCSIGDLFSSVLSFAFTQVEYSYREELSFLYRSLGLCRENIGFQYVFVELVCFSDSGLLPPSCKNVRGGRIGIEPS